MFPVTPSDEITAVWRAARPDLDLVGMEVFGRLRRLQALHDLEMDSLHGGAPLSSAELDVLVIMRHAGEPMIARGLAVLRGCSRAAMSSILGKLERRGLITRDPNPADRRASLVRLSKTGSQLVDEVFPRRLAVENRLLSSLTPGRPGSRHRGTGPVDQSDIATVTVERRRRSLSAIRPSPPGCATTPLLRSSVRRAGHGDGSSPVGDVQDTAAPPENSW